MLAFFYEPFYCVTSILLCSRVLLALRLLFVTNDTYSGLIRVKLVTLNNLTFLLIKNILTLT